MADHFVGVAGMSYVLIIFKESESHEFSVCDPVDDG